MLIRINIQYSGNSLMVIMLIKKQRIILQNSVNIIINLRNANLPENRLKLVYT